MNKIVMFGYTILHRDFLGAHRYTTRGGIVRPAGGVLPTAVVCLRQPIGDVALPLRFTLFTNPFAHFVLGEDPQSRASPGPKTAVLPRQYRVLAQRQKERVIHGG